MPTTITTPSNTQAKIRFQEQYVSEGLNKKLNGVIPRGIIRGGLLVTAGAGFNLRIDPDPDSGDSVYSYIDANGHQITFRQVGAVTLDLTAVANTKVYICLYVNYTTSTATVVEWRTYSEVELLTAPVVEAPYLVVLGRVVVPAAGPIASTSIDPLERREAWDAVSRSTLQWHQVVSNSRFDIAAPGALTATNLEGALGWNTGTVALGGGGRTWSVSTIAPRSGPHEFQVNGGAGSTIVASVDGRERWAVEPDTKIRVRTWIRGDSWGGVGVNGVQGVVIHFYDTDGVTLGTPAEITNNALSGTFAYTQLDEIVKAPATAAFMSYALRLDPDGLSPTGSLFWDDVQVFVQSDAPLDAMLKDRKWSGFVAGHGITVTPTNQFSTIGDFMNTSARLFELDKITEDVPSLPGSVATYIQKRLGVGGEGRMRFDWKRGSHIIPGRIEDLGSDRLGTAVEAAVEPLFGDAVNVALAATSEYTLVEEWTDGVSLHKVRKFLKTDGTDMALVTTVNAKFDGSLWSKDDTAISSMKTETSVRSTQHWTKDDGAGTWNDATWSILIWELADDSATIPRRARLELRDGRLEMSNAGTNAGGSNPIATGAVIPNAYYAKNCINAWGQIDINSGVLQSPAGSGTSSGGFGVTSYALTDANFSVTVTFQNSFTDIGGGPAIGYAILASAERALTTINATRIGNSSFKLFLADPTALDLSGGAVSVQIFWAVLGHNV